MSDKSSNSPAMAFILGYLKEHGDTEYAVVRAAAEKEGHVIYPIMYGRAKTLLGMITEESRRRRRKKAAEDATVAAVDYHASHRALRQGRPPAMSAAATEQLNSFLERYREVEAERNRYRAALIQVEKMLKAALEEARPATA